MQIISSPDKLLNKLRKWCPRPNCTWWLEKLKSDTISAMVSTCCGVMVVAQKYRAACNTCWDKLRPGKFSFNMPGRQEGSPSRPAPCLEPNTCTRWKPRTQILEWLGAPEYLISSANEALTQRHYGCQWTCECQEALELELRLEIVVNNK